MAEIEQKYDVEERLAILEERTKQKKKSLLDNLKDYGGVAALLIAIGYSWPLGVFDRFVLSPNEKHAERIATLKTVLLDSVKILVEGSQSLATINDPTLYDIASRSYGNQLALIISKHKDSFFKEWKAFSPEELIIIGLNFQYIYDIENSLKFFKFAADRAPEKSVAKIEAGRQLGKSYFLPSEFQNISMGRSKYRATIDGFSGSRDIRLISQEITLRSEWGYFEMTAGDWKCGQTQMDIALEIAGKWQDLLSDQGNTLRLLQMKRYNLTQKGGQPARGCDQ